MTIVSRLCITYGALVEQQQTKLLWKVRLDEGSDPVISVHILLSVYMIWGFEFTPLIQNVSILLVRCLNLYKTYEGIHITHLVWSNALLLKFKHLVYL